MGEPSTCLVRSFSTPADTSCMPQESRVVLVEDRNQTWISMSLCDPIRALGESISFGRFMTEGLDWERWSAFSHKRYVEEAEKYSKPGSVAAKKAYFEAHYKKKAAERAAAMIQEAMDQANGTLDSEAWEGNCGYADPSIEINSKADDNSSIEMNSKADNNSSIEMNSKADDNSSFEMNSKADDNSSIEMNSKADENIVTANGQPVKEIISYQVVECADINQYKYDTSQNDLDTSNVEGEEDVPHPCVDTNLNMESCTLVDDSNQFHHVELHKNMAVPVEERTLDHDTGDQEVLALSVKGREVNSSPKLSTKTRAAKLPHSLDERKAAAAVPSRSGIHSKSKKFAGNTIEKKPAARSLHMSIGLPSDNGETSKKIAAATQSRNGSFSTSKKYVGSTDEKKRITAPSLYMSVNLPSGTGVTIQTATAAVKPRNGINFAAKSMKCVGDSVEKRSTASKTVPDETSKTTSVIEQPRIKKIRSNWRKDNPVALRTSTKASHGLLNQPSANLPSQGRRIERLHNKSVSGGVTANAKLSSSISVDCFSSSSTTKSNPQSATISSPFRFRSEERAAKRKEFLQRMDATKSKEEEKVQLQRIPKGKTEDNPKKLKQGNGSILNEDRPGGSQPPSNHIRKSSPTLPRSPKFGRKASCSAVQNKNLGNSWKPPIFSNNSKRVTEKFNRTTRQSVTSLSNTTRENASPNIQHLRT